MAKTKAKAAKAKRRGAPQRQPKRAVKKRPKARPAPPPMAPDEEPGTQILSKAQVRGEIEEVLAIDRLAEDE